MVELNDTTLSSLSSLSTPDLNTLTTLTLKEKDISSIGNISTLKNLRKLCLSSNNIAEGEHIAKLAQTPALTFLDISKNKLNTLEGCDSCPELTVLNASHNQINTISKHIAQCKKLKAVVLNHNKITKVQNLSTLVELNTIILSHNDITTFPSLPSLKQLKKLSVAHNNIAVFPDLTGYGETLRELRLNDNQISKVPDAVVGCGGNLEIVDLGNNAIKNWIDIIPLGLLSKLSNLNLKGNPLSQRSEYREKILQLIPSLRILDGERFDALHLARKARQKERDELLQRIEDEKSKLPVVVKVKRKSEEGGAAKKKRIKTEFTEGDSKKTLMRTQKSDGEEMLNSEELGAARSGHDKKESVSDSKRSGVANKTSNESTKHGMKAPNNENVTTNDIPAKSPSQASMTPTQVIDAINSAKSKPLGFKNAKREAKRLLDAAVAAGVDVGIVPSVADLMGKSKSGKSKSAEENVPEKSTDKLGSAAPDRLKQKKTKSSSGSASQDAFFDSGSDDDDGDEITPAVSAAKRNPNVGKATASVAPSLPPVESKPVKKPKSRATNEPKRATQRATVPSSPPPNTIEDEPASREQTGVVAVLHHNPKKRLKVQERTKAGGTGVKSLLRDAKILQTDSGDNGDSIAKLFAAGGGTVVGNDVGGGIGGGWD